MNKDLCKRFLENLKDPAWLIGFDGKYIYANKAYIELHNIPMENIEGRNIEEFFDAKFVQKYKKDIGYMEQNLEYLSFESKTRDIDFESRMFPVFDEDNNPIGIAGLKIEITNRKKREDELLKEKTLLQKVVDTIPDIIFLKDTKSRYILINKALREHYKRYGVTEILGKTDIEINPNSVQSIRFMNDDQKIIKERTLSEFEPTVIYPDGEKRIKLTTKAPVISSKDNVIGVVGIARDITKEKALEEKLKYLSYTDSLTGALNRSCFEDKLEGYLGSDKVPLGIIMGDVNGLKLVNDTFGHMEGDKLLVAITEVIKKVCGDYTDIFRWGGDEFVIIVPNATESALDNIITLIKRECSLRKQELIELSISMGWGIYTDNSESIYEILGRAEERVYKHKLLEQKSIVSSSLNSLLETLETKSAETRDHTIRMCTNAILVGKKLGMSISELDELDLATRLHDIGKIGIPEQVLLKPAKLTEEEFQIMKTHSDKGYRIVLASNGLESVAKAVLTHHEKYNGTGYPLQLKGEEIPLAARIISVVDAYDAMISRRPYKDAQAVELALEEIQICSGTHFDPHIAKIFIEIIKKGKNKPSLKPPRTINYEF